MKPALTSIAHGNGFGTRSSRSSDLQQPAPTPKALRQRSLRERVATPANDLPIRNSTVTTAAYRFPELNASVRPGAMDACALPSVVMGERIYRKARP